MSERTHEVTQTDDFAKEHEAYMARLARQAEVKASNKESKERYIADAGPKEVMDGLTVAAVQYAITTKRLAKELEGGKTHKELDAEIYKHVQNARGLTATRTIHEEWSKLEDEHRPKLEEYVSKEWHNLPVDEEGRPLDKSRAHNLGLAEDWLENNYANVMGNSWFYTQHLKQDIPKPDMEFSLGSQVYQNMANYVQLSEWEAQRVMSGEAV